jgi:hypothetical protein
VRGRRPYVPIAPVLAVLADRGATTPLEISRITGLDRSGLHRAIQRGHISLWAADRICTRIDRHIDEVYGGELEEVAS